MNHSILQTCRKERFSWDQQIAICSENKPSLLANTYLETCISHFLAIDAYGIRHIDKSDTRNGTSIHLLTFHEFHPFQPGRQPFSLERFLQWCACILWVSLNRVLALGDLLIGRRGHVELKRHLRYSSLRLWFQVPPLSRVCQRPRATPWKPEYLDSTWSLPIHSSARRVSPTPLETHYETPRCAAYLESRAEPWLRAEQSLGPQLQSRSVWLDSG
jgi:hypothetical protein